MGKDKAIRRLYCKSCGTRFSERQGSLMEYAKLPESTVVRIIKCLGYGCSIEALFRPIGCEHWWFQYYDGGNEVGRHPSHGMGMPARDLARIAYCMLRNGMWNGKQVIPKWFVEQTAQPSDDVTTPEMRFKVPAQTFSLGWELPALLTGEGGTPSGKGIPADARYKPGSGGQLIAFVPSLNLVITRQTGSSGDWQYPEYLRRACAAVLME